MENEVKMVLPCQCPHCGEDIVIKLDLPAPNVTGVLKPDEVDENIKKIIDEEDDTVKKPTAK